MKLVELSNGAITTFLKISVAEEKYFLEKNGILENGDTIDITVPSYI